MVKTICIIDDEEALIENLIYDIKELQPEWKVIGFNSGLEAIKEVMKGTVNVVVTDIAMPDMDGYEVFWRVRDHNAKLPVIIMTGFGYDPNHVLVRSRQDGLQNVIYKPFETAKLVEMIESIL